LIHPPVDHGAVTDFLSVYPKPLKKDAFGVAGTMTYLLEGDSL
jgi:hypothetical protein